MAQHTAPQEAAQTERPSRRPLLTGAVVGVVVVFALVLGFAWFSGEPEPATGPAAVAAGENSPGAGELPVSSTFTTVDGAPLDDGAAPSSEGLVVHPVRETPVHDSPGGRAIARMEPTQIVGATWLPVLAEEPDWVQVLLPSKPNGSTGWLRAADVERASTPYLVTVHLESKRLELQRGGDVVGEWPIGIGTESSPTPTGRTFMHGAFSDDKQNYSPVILPLGTHSPTHDTYGGGPGTVAIHTWPTDDVYGTAVSDGCIRVPADALDQLTEVPLGTLVLIDQE